MFVQLARCLTATSQQGQPDEGGQDVFLVVHYGFIPIRVIWRPIAHAERFTLAAGLALDKPDSAKIGLVVLGKPMISRIYSRFCQTLPAPEGSRGLLVAFSGGLDSTVLLVLAARFATRPRPRPERPARSSRPEPTCRPLGAHCEGVCRQLAVPPIVERVQLCRGNGESLEAQARAARYERLAAHLGGEWLLTAHHQDDRLETLLLALKRGAGLRGLAGMVASQPFCRRPSCCAPCSI